MWIISQNESNVWHFELSCFFLMYNTLYSSNYSFLLFLGFYSSYPWTWVGTYYNKTPHSPAPQHTQHSWCQLHFPIGFSLIVYLLELRVVAILLLLNCTQIHSNKCTLVICREICNYNNKIKLWVCHVPWTPFNKML